ncbi:hypothetical protein Tco_0436264 [Tanacetum coccineum]
MIVDESLDMIVDESLMVEDKSLEKLVDETLKLDEEHFESVIADCNLSVILTFLSCSSSQADLYLTEKELHQLHLDEEALRETLEEQAMDAKAREEKIRQKQADDDEFFLEFGMVRIDSDYESSN